MGAHDYINSINQPAGRKFDKDNSKLFSMLTLATLDTLVKLTLCLVWTYVNNFKNQLDGRAAMMALRDH